MLIVVPYVAGELQPETESAFIGWPGKVEKRCLDDIEFGYWRLLKELWRGGSDVVIVEQDIAPRIEELRALEMCPELVCGYRYQREGGSIMALGLLRWRAKLSNDVPWLLEREQPPEVRYDECDGRMFGRFAAINVAVHDHGETQHFRRRTLLLEVPARATT